ncbi:MAG: uroporphyrinogen decarboxylase family protein [Candidatus Humimicrobiaceae bacterium]
MNSRERVNLAINHKEPDRIPIDLWGTDSRLLNEFYFKVIKYLGLEPSKIKVRPGKSAEYVDYRISDLVGSDFRHIVIGQPEIFKPYYDEDGVKFDEWGIGHKIKGEFNYIYYHPLKDSDISDIKKFKGPNIKDPGRIKGIDIQARDWFENTQYSITTTGPISGFIKEYYEYLRGTENFFMDLYLNVSLAEHLIAKLTDIFTDFYIYFITPIAKYLTWIEFESDFGMQDRPFISRDLFRKFLKAPMGKVISEVKKIAPQAKIFLHSCGSIKELMGEFVDIGIDIISGIQPLARDMESDKLKKEFGKDIVFHGGVDAQKALCGSLEDTVSESKKRISDFAPGGGYIFGPSNHFLIDVPVENFLAMYETAKNYGKYPIKVDNDKV